MTADEKRMSETEIFSNSFDMLVFLDDFCKENEIQYFLHAGTLLGSIRHQGFIPWDDDVDVCMTRKNFKKLLETFRDNKKYELQFYDRIQGYRSPYGKLRDKRTLRIDNISGKPYSPEQGLDIDIFIIDGYSNNEIIRKIHFIIQDFLFRMYVSSGANPETKKGLKKYAIKLYQIFVKQPTMARIVNTFAGIWNIDKSEYAGCMMGLYRHKIEQARSDSFKGTSSSVFEGKLFPVPRDADDVLRSIYGSDYMIPPPPEKRKSTHSSYVVWKSKV
jgi:lipopolysaccharide cholinephosphotransferase